MVVLVLVGKYGIVWYGIGKYSVGKYSVGNCSVGKCSVVLVGSKYAASRVKTASGALPAKG